MSPAIIRRKQIRVEIREVDGSGNAWTFFAEYIFCDEVTR